MNLFCEQCHHIGERLALSFTNLFWISRRLCVIKHRPSEFSPVFPKAGHTRGFLGLVMDLDTEGELRLIRRELAANRQAGFLIAEQQDQLVRLDAAIVMRKCELVALERAIEIARAEARALSQQGFRQ
jgi:hypothetical protein